MYIRREIGLKRGLYWRIKRGEVQVVGQYNDLAKKVKKDIRAAKRNYEVKLARDAQKAKAKKIIGSVKGMDGSLVENGEEISKELNKYFLSVFSQEESNREMELVQIFSGKEVDKLSDIVISREVVSREINRL